MHVFVYGTLTAPARADAILDSYVFVGPAILDGLHAVDGRYPTLAPGGEVAGRLLRTDEIDALDEYEGVDQGLYVRVTVPGSDQLPEIAVYVGNPESLEADVTWPGEGSFDERVRRYLAEQRVCVRSIE